MTPSVKMMPLASLKSAPYNPRRISPQAMAGLHKSIEEFGLVQPIVWNKRTKRVVAGHQRVEAMKQMGHKEALVLIVDWPEIKEKAANLTLNNRAVEGEFTEDVEDLQREIEEDDQELFHDLNLDEIDADAEGHEEDEQPLDEIVSVGAHAPRNTGEMWVLDRHRIMCGDSTNKVDLNILMAKDTTQMVFTDPPYGVEYQARTGRFGKIKGDDKKADDLVNDLLVPAFRNAVDCTEDDAAFYIWHASSTREDFALAMKKVGLVERQYIIWAKPAAVLGWGDYRWAHEPCFYASKDGEEPAFYGDRTQSTVWRMAWHGMANLTSVSSLAPASSSGT